MAKEKVIKSTNISLCDFNDARASISMNMKINVLSPIFCIDRRVIMSDAAKSFDSNSSSTTLKETRIDNRIECSGSLSTKKVHKMALQRQDSIDHSQNISNNNQDVSVTFEFKDLYSINVKCSCYLLLFVAVHCSFITGTTF